MTQFVLPDHTKRTTILGRTGSGKSWFAVWLLGLMNYNHMPWIIFDFKDDELLNSLGAVRLAMGELPQNAGLYIVSVDPFDYDGFDDMMFQCWRRGNTGILIDEAMSDPVVKSKGYAKVMTQGRSRHVPCISCSQRPAWLSRVTLSESDYISVFSLNNKTDRVKVNDFIADGDEDFYKPLPDYYSRWYDVGNNNLLTMKPVPEKRLLIEKFNAKIEKQKPRVI